MGNMKEYLINYTEKKKKKETKPKKPPHTPVAMYAGTYWLLGRQSQTQL